MNLCCADRVPKSYTPVVWSYSVSLVDSKRETSGNFRKLTFVSNLKLSKSPANWLAIKLSSKGLAHDFLDSIESALDSPLRSSRSLTLANLLLARILGP